MHYLFLYVLIINIVTFLIFGLDKQKARRRKWRISEKSLFLLAILGGSIGAETGMRYFHHKTKHARFVFGIPLILAVQIVLFLFILSLSNR